LISAIPFYNLIKAPASSLPVSRAFNFCKVVKTPLAAIAPVPCSGLVFTSAWSVSNYRVISNPLLSRYLGNDFHNPKSESLNKQYQLHSVLQISDKAATAVSATIVIPSGIIKCLFICALAICQYKASYFGAKVIGFVAFVCVPIGTRLLEDKDGTSAAKPAPPPNVAA